MNGSTPQTLHQLIKLLTEAGEDELAQRLTAHSEARQRDVPTDEIVKLWLD